MLYRLLIVLVAWLALAGVCSAAFTEFYCNASTGSNMNGGSDANTSPSYSFTNGGWDATTGVYTPTSGDPSASVTVGQYASVFIDGATAPVFIGRVTAVSSTTITVSTTIKCGTAPTTLGTTRSINVGGAWKGPTGTSGFPFTLVAPAMRATGDSAMVRVNFKNNADYLPTATMTMPANTGVMLFEGYTTTPGDGGRAKIDGGVAGNRYILLAASSAVGAHFKNIWFTRAGGASTAQVGVTAGTTNNFYGCVFSNFSSNGTSGGNYWGCEAYSNGVSGFATPNWLAYCTAYNNSTYGFDLTGVFGARFCIAHNNTSHGFYCRATAARSVQELLNCDSYENGVSGVVFQRDAAANVHTVQLINCNFVKNGTWGIAIAGTGTQAAITLRNVRFGAGTFANTSGTVQSGALMTIEEGYSSYANDVSPWVDPEAANFNINLAAAINAGWGAFLQTATGLGYTFGTVGYPDIGAAQHQESGGARLSVPAFNTFVQ